MAKRIEKEARLEKLRERFLADLAKLGLTYDYERMAYRELGGEPTEMWTAFARFPGERWWAEEIDVLVSPREGKGKAREIAEKVIQDGFDPRLKVGKLVHRPRGIMFF